LRRPDWALVEVLMLWVSIALLIAVLGMYSFTAGLLLVPYIVWVSVAAFLNYEVVRLNGPFNQESQK
jgi:translocator protein